MASRVTFPTDAIKRALAEVAKEEPKIVKRALTTTGQVIRKAQRKESPYHKGFLRRSHQYEVSGEGRSVTLSANTDYALVVHETHKTQRRWFVAVLIGLGPSTLRKALEAAIKKFRG